MNTPPPALAPRPVWRRALKPAFTVVALVAVFGWLLPQFIDYQEVWDAIRQLDGWEALLLLGVARSHPQWLGTKTQRPLSWMLVKLKRDPLDDAPGKTAALYAGAGRPSAGLGAGLNRSCSQALPDLPDPARRTRFVGVAASELPAAEAFAAFAAAALVWRVFYSVITLPLGAVTIARYRRATPDASEAAVTKTPAPR